MSNQTPAPTVWPAFQARDAHALIDFLVDVVGFEKTAVYEDGDTVAHAQLDWPEGGGIMMGSHKPGGEWSREPGTFGAYVVTDRVDELYERIKGAGATITRELADQDYGNREFSIADPEGNLWSFGPYRGEPRSR
ncbi:VOC family protein [Solicola gregarius]|uniref:VOC family protein n=1 Tax=Solicola gregarius TaxID=2908642 RepID=A0AA46TFF9_9ACTN|nr:VOC family protein [Solicola gregarius]UYM04175.1 VOC family protein [Solicola gregarius]